MRHAGCIQSGRPFIHFVSGRNREGEMIEAEVVRVEGRIARGHELHESDHPARASHDTCESSRAVLSEELFEAEHLPIPLGAHLAVTNGQSDMAESEKAGHRVIIMHAAT